MRFTLADAANYLQTKKLPAHLRAVVRDFEEIFDFGEERDNRLRRYIAIARAYAAGTSIAAIAAEYDCSKRTILHYARMADLPKRPRHLPEQIREAVLRDYRNKLPIAKIAALHHVSPAYVSKTAHDEGIGRYAHGRDGLAHRRARKLAQASSALR